jgi:hypothetical protein
VIVGRRAIRPFGRCSRRSRRTTAPKSRERVRRALEPVALVSVSTTRATSIRPRFAASPTIVTNCRTSTEHGSPFVALQQRMPLSCLVPAWK